MKNEEINVAIAKLCGLSVYETADRYGTKDMMVWDGKDIGSCRDLPNYCEDLNAMHEVVSNLGITWLDEYAAALCKVTGLTINLLFLASAQQMAEAYLSLFKKAT